MNILVCGKNNQYLYSLAERLKREKNEIHYISGSKAAEKVGRVVFQQFDFEYTNANIGRIVKSAKPDVMILLGATDRNFAWRNPVDDAMTFVSGMSSLLMAAKGAGVRRIIFISSITIFEHNTGEIRRDTEPDASSPMNDALLQVENLCATVTDENTEAVILRLPPDTGYYSDSAMNDYCLLNARNYLRGDQIVYQPGAAHATIYYMDSIDAIMKLISIPVEDLKRIYQLQGVVYTEQEYVDALQKTGLKKNANTEIDLEKAEIVPAYTNLEESDEDTLHFSVRFQIDEIADKVCKAINSHKKETEPTKKEKLHVVPVIEAIVAAVLVTVITYFLHDTWVGSSLCLFIFYSLLFGAVYGTTYGLFTGVLATIGTLVIQWHDAGLIHTIENYSFFLNFLEFVLVGVIAGYMHDKYIRKTTTVTEERNYLAAEVSDLTRINDNNIYVKNIYEKRLVGYENSLPKLYEMTSQLDFMEPENVIFHAVKVTQELLEVDDVAIYMSSQRSSFYRLNAANSERAASCGKSFKYDEECFLFAAFEQREIFKNKEMDPDKPSFAGAVMDEDRINAIIMVWTRNLHKVNQYECDMLAIVCRLIEKSIARANVYNEAVRADSYIGGGRIMKEDVFLSRFRNFEEGRKQGVFTYTLLRLEKSGSDAETAQRLTRDTDVLGRAGGHIYILLPFSNEKDSEHVVNRFANQGMKTTFVNPEEMEFLFSEEIEEEKAE